MPIKSAVGVATANRSGIAVKVEAAMRRALEDALRRGETDQNILRRVIVDAHNTHRARNR